MNAKRREAAIKKYSGLEREDVALALPTDDKGYTAEEQAEILAALFDEQTPSPAPTKPSAPAKTAQSKSIVVDEWRVEFPNGVHNKPEKLKLLRTGIKLRQEAIDELNGSANPHNPIMYFEPEK